MNVEELIDHRYCIVVSRRSPSARRARIKLVELVNERWIVPPADIPGRFCHNPSSKRHLSMPAANAELMITTFQSSCARRWSRRGSTVRSCRTVLRLHPDKLRETADRLADAVSRVAIRSLQPGPQSRRETLHRSGQSTSRIDCRRPRADKSIQGNQPRDLCSPGRSVGRMSPLGVRRDKAALSSGCKPHPATAPAGSNRSSHGGNEVAEAFG